MANHLKDLILPLALLTFVGGCYAVSSTSIGNALASEEYRVLEPFDRVVVTGTFDIEIVRDSVHSVLVILDENLIPRVSTSVQEGSLHIRVKERFSNYIRARLIIGSPYISQVKMMGNNRLRAMEVDNDVLEITTSGAVHMELAGLVDQLNLILDGRNVVNAADLEALYVDLRSDGVSTCSVNAVRSIRATGTGSTRVWYAGTPGSVESEIEGRGFVMKLEERES